MSATSLSSTAARAGGGRLWVLLLKLLISLGLLVLVGRAVDLQAVGGLLLALPLWAGLAAVLCLAGVSLVSALRWWLVMRSLGAALPLGRITALMFVGNFFTQVLPTSVGGDAVRIWLVTRRGVAFNQAFNGVILERATGLIVVVFMVAGGVFWLGGLVDQAAIRLALLAALPLLLGALTLLCLLDRLPASLALSAAALPLAGAALNLLAVMAGDARRVLLAQPLSLYLLLLSLAAQVFAVLAVLALAQGLGLSLSLVEALAVVPAVILITFVPLSFAGWGIREGAAVVMFGFVGVAADQAVAVSVLFGLGLLVAGLPGCVLWVKGGRRLPPAAASV
ncbi:MAG: lysylphosphatidylglycerol synthase transmembrane domain-containing protein [Kiloniellaceae bacterium]